MSQKSWRQSWPLILTMVITLAITGATLASSASIAAPIGKESVKALVQVQEETARAVVMIESYTKRPDGILGRRNSGSGFAILQDGRVMVVSNNHVVTGGEELWARTADKTIPPFELGVLGYSPFLDLALLEIKKANLSLTPARLGDSDALKADDPVIAIGSPLGIPFLAFRGVVTKPDEMLSITIHPSLIISDVKANPGNSGGPLFTLAGEVVGINTLIMGQNPISLSIPINHLKQLLPRLKLGGELKHAVAGVVIRNSWEMNPPDYKNAKIEPPKRHGVVVIQVAPGSPAAKTDMKPGDLILEATLRGEKTDIPDTKALMKLIMLRALPDDELTLLTLRGENQYLTMRLRLAERPAPKPGAEDPFAD